MSEDRSGLAKTGRILQYVGLALFFVPFLAIPGGIACTAMNMGGGQLPEIFVIGPGSMCIGFGGFFVAAVGSIMQKVGERSAQPAWPTQPAAPERVYVKRENCSACGAPPGEGPECRYCGTRY